MVRADVARSVALAARSEPAHRDLERVRTAVPAERDHLAVQDDGCQRQSANRLDDLGDALGDVGEAARVGADLVVAAVHLEARAVELPLDHGRRDALEGFRHAGSRLGEHRLDGTEELEPEACQAGRALGQRDLRHPLQAACEHRRAANLRGRHACRLRDRLDHDALERALAELAVDDPAKEPLLRLRCAPEELVELLLAHALRSGPRGRAQAVEHGGDLEHVEGGSRPPAAALATTPSRRGAAPPSR